MRIGHSSINEKGKISGGVKGDQTGKEVCIREWYSKPWDLVLRCTDPQKAELMAIACEQGCANNNIGYDQPYRNTLDRELQKVGYDMSKVNTPCACDCSSYMTDCGRCAGIKIPDTNGNAPTTSTMERVFKATGMFEVLKDKKYTTKSEYLKRGDILVKAGSHTVMVLDDGALIKVSAPAKTSRKYQLGIDVSENQKVIDWEKVKASGITFACLRSTKKNFKADAYFERNLNECIRLNIDYSCYKYGYATTEAEAMQEADSVIALLKGRSMMVWYDVEDNVQKALGKQKLEKVIRAFINRCNLHGIKVGIYTYDSFYKAYITDFLKQNYLFWLSRYGKNDGTLNENYKPSGEWFAWQYTSKGRIPGINGDVDLDVM